MVATNYTKYLNPELRELWHYDPGTGKFTSKVNTHGHARRIRIGDEVGTIRKDGYVQLGHHGTQYQAHMLAWVWMKGLPPKGKEVDHRNKIKSDNKWTNLRLLGRGANVLNHGGPRSDSTTGVRGVYRKRNKFRAGISIDGKEVSLGVFDTIEEAAEARRRAETRYWRVPIEEEA